MELDFSVAAFPGSSDGSDWGRFQSRGRERILLHEPERCVQCGRHFESLYAIKGCAEHKGLKSI